MKHKNIFFQSVNYLWTQNSAKLRFFIIIAFVCLLLARVTNAFVPILFKYVVDSIGNDALPFTLLILIAYCISRFVSQLFNELKEIVFVEVEQESVKKLSLDVFRHLHSLSLRFHLDRKTGVITRSVERGAKALETSLRFLMFNIFPTVFEILVVSVALYVIYPVMYMVTILLVLFCYAFYTIYITEWRANYIRKMKEAENQGSFRAVESLINYETVKYFTSEQHESDKYNGLLEKYKRVTIKNRYSLSILNLGQSAIICTGLLIIIISAYFKVETGLMTLGDLVLINMYLVQLYYPLSNLGFAYREIKLAFFDMEHMFSLLDEKQEIKDKHDAHSLVMRHAEIEFANVNFYYNKDRKILSDVSFNIPIGKTLAIVGPSGAGKSTITRLLFRFYEVSSGRILVDGNNVDELRQESLRKVIGVVPQDSVLFNDTIAYNINYGRDDASFTEVQEAAKIAEIHDFIESLPEGYNTVVGERGLKLSGGEKQRIAIARAILKQPKIFVFDEATSSLDTRTEYAIQQSINRISAGHTTIIIAHRLSTIVHADEIIVFEYGKVVGQGKHHELLKENSLYTRMWDQQKMEQ